jgi:hypothetical protein
MYQGLMKKFQKSFKKIWIVTQYLQDFLYAAGRPHIRKLKCGHDRQKRASTLFIHL